MGRFLCPLLRPSPPLPTDAKPRAEPSSLELCRGAKEEKPPLGGLNGDLGNVTQWRSLLRVIIDEVALSSIKCLVRE